MKAKVKKHKKDAKVKNPTKKKVAKEKIYEEKEKKR
jgi:hypothetical protein